jgi:hypothetical protein
MLKGMRFRLVGAGVALLVLSSAATAQHQTFVDALSEFTAALPGTYGDEGVAARASLDRLERGLAEWDQTLKEYDGDALSVPRTV